MRHNSSFRQGQKKDEERKKLLKAAVIPLVVVILMLVIIIADRDKDTKEKADAEPAVVAETLLEPESEPDVPKTPDMRPEGPEIPKPEPILKKDANPELLSMMKKYFEARATGDAEILNELYGIEGLSVTALEAEKTRMRSNSKYLRGFENIVTYVADGIAENEWLVYSTCDIRFHSVETVAPMIMWCYVVQQEDGRLLIQKPEELSPEVQHHVDLISRSQEVRGLASDINVRLKEALLTDADLNEVYGVLRDGSPVYQGEEAEEKDAVQILDGADESSAADTESESEAGPESEAEPEVSAESDAESDEAAEESMDETAEGNADDVSEETAAEAETQG